MTNLCKSLILPTALVCVLGAGCEKKKVALAPPRLPEPVTTASNRDTTTATRTAPTPPAHTTPAPATAKSDYPDKATRDRIDELLGRISDAYFDYDKHSLRADAVETLQKDAVELRNILRDYPHYRLVIEGYADERGSSEYNLGLGEARAQSAKNFLVDVGIPAQQLSTVTFGKERQICAEHNEACWQKNRRIHIVPTDKRA
jgi:peptidoglycan-associated lipoprotein